MNPQSDQKVVGVCGNEARIYNVLNGKYRALIGIRTFSHHGAAVQFAQEYEESAKKK